MQECGQHTCCMSTLVVYSGMYMKLTKKNSTMLGNIGVLVVVCMFAVFGYISLTPVTFASCDVNTVAQAQFGSSGQHIRALQECLIGAGYAIPAGATGYYGTQTQTAVRMFLAKTASTTATHTNSSQTHTCDTIDTSRVQYGQSNADVEMLQRCLIQAGYSIPAGVTGYYGEQTRSAVRAFYAQVIQMSEWHGNSVGPVGKSALSLHAGMRTTATQAGTSTQYRTAKDATDLAQYANAERSYYGTFSNTFNKTTIAMEMDNEGTSAPTADMSLAPSVAPSGRVSTTNVQVVGIDEPDMVKTDGTNLFVSNLSTGYRWFEPMPVVIDDMVRESDEAYPRPFESTPTHIIKAFPPKDLALASDTITESGDMLLVQDKKVLIVFSYPSIVAYNVADSKKPVKIWNIGLKDDTSVVTARLLGDKVYLVTQTYLQSSRPCPITPMSQNGIEMVVPCASILVPDRVEPASHMYTASIIDSTTGNQTQHTTWVGEGSEMTVFMSTKNLYVASRSYNPQYRVLADLMIETLTPHLSATSIARARTIQTYDISEVGKMQEIEKLFQSELARFTADERLRIENEAANLFQDGLKKRIRDMYRTRIVRMPLDTLTMVASAEVPGYLLNQFAMDEYEGNLRVAVTVDDRWGGLESANDVYVLNSNLAIVGSVIDLGLSERVYAVRFMGDKGYVVTFRQIDPFYVLDMSVPTNPKVTGELKIPGYSAYLEYLEDNLVLGVGREGNGVKLSVFDVRDASRPLEKAKYQLKDSWSEVESNHHAFLRDSENKLFFIPGGEGGYVFSYKDGALSLAKTFAGYGIKRAVYIDNYFYVVSEDTIRVFDMETWSEVKDLSF